MTSECVRSLGTDTDERVNEMVQRALAAGALSVPHDLTRNGTTDLLAALS